MPRSLTKSEEDFLNQNLVARLATVSEDCESFVSPVCFAHSAGIIYIVTEPTTRKSKNISANGKATFVVDEFPDFWKNRGLVVRGRATLLQSDRDVEEYSIASRLLKAKYKEFEEALAPTDLIIALRPERVTSWGV
jgi:nitroimidazol reductase NimA-like FMN-containing flavoprotein (pyridoxamine 5'-phosphate oxidase superfamily)